MHGKQIKVIKRGQRNLEATAPQTPSEQTIPPVAERELKEVISGWVREHQRRSEEFRENYSSLLNRLGFKSPAANRLAMASAAQK